MKLVTFRAARGASRAGALIDDGTHVLDLQAAHRARYGRGLAAVSAACSRSSKAATTRSRSRARSSTAKRRPKAAVLARDAVKLAAPIPQPPQMRDFLCFEKHLRAGVPGGAQAARARSARIPEAALARDGGQGNPRRAADLVRAADLLSPEPVQRVRARGRRALAGLLRRCSTSSSSSAATSAAPGKDIPRERARDHIFGYTIFNDFSARDEQTKEMPGQLGPGKGKDFDNANAMGPCLVTADEIPDPYALDMMVRVNGEEWGRGNSREHALEVRGLHRARRPRPRRCIPASSSAPAPSATAADSSSCAS